VQCAEPINKTNPAEYVALLLTTEEATQGDQPVDLMFWTADVETTPTEKSRFCVCRRKIMQYNLAKKEKNFIFTQL
jgi:hypothetical protein